MYSFSSHRIGTRASPINRYAASTESSVLRSLFELRKTDRNDEEHLTFWNCSWSKNMLRSLRKILVRDGRKFASIKFFDCAIQSSTANNDGGGFFAEILSMIADNSSTTSLVIRGGMIQHQPLSSCSDCSCTPFVEVLSEALSQNSAFASITLRQTSLDDESIAQLVQSARNNSTLTTLNLSRNYLGARKSNAAFAGTQAMDAIIDLLQSQTSNLQCLNLSHQYQVHPITATIAPVTEEEANKQIQHYQAAFGKALIALSTNTSLRDIDLSCNPGILSDSSSVKALTSCLSANASLEHANVSGCGMAPESLRYLATECLPACGASLKSLVLFGSEPTDVATNNSCPNKPTRSSHDETCYRNTASALEKGLSSNTTLENLGDLSCSEMFETIQHTLNLNKGGRRAIVQSRNTFSSSPLPLAAWSQLLARADRLDYASDETTPSVVFSLLRQGTILFEH